MEVERIELHSTHYRAIFSEIPTPFASDYWGQMRSNQVILHLRLF
jgi:hypothetical protein